MSVSFYGAVHDSRGIGLFLETDRERHVAFISDYVEEESVPDEIYLYQVRKDDESDGPGYISHCQLEKNFYGTIITNEPLEFEESEVDGEKRFMPILFDEMKWAWEDTPEIFNEEHMKQYLGNLLDQIDNELPDHLKKKLVIIFSALIDTMKYDTIKAISEEFDNYI